MMRDFVSGRQKGTQICQEGMNESGRSAADGEELQPLQGVYQIDLGFAVVN